VFSFLSPKMTTVMNLYESRDYYYEGQLNHPAIALFSPPKTAGGGVVEQP